MKTLGKRGMALLLSLMMCLSMLVVPAAAEEAGTDTEPAAETAFDIDKSKTADPTELTPENKETEITLSLPSGEYQNKIDVVFVTDSSGSTDLGQVFIDAATNLYESIVENNPNIELKVGVVLYTGRGNDAIKYVSDGAYEGLTPYNDDTKDFFKKSFEIRDTMAKATFQSTFGRGSGPHSGLDMADEWLTADTEVDDDHKYVVLYTDGKGYIWNDDNNVPTTIYSQYYQWARGVGAHNVAYGGIVSVNQAVGYNKKAYSLDVLDPVNKSNVVFYDSYEALYALTDEELTGVNEWDQKCSYAIDTTQPAGSVVKHPTTNGVSLFGDVNYAYWFEWIPDEAWEGVPYLQINPYAVIDNQDGTYTFDTDTINPYYYQYHFDCLQKGLYKAGHLWTDMNDKYNCAVVTYDSSTGSGLELVGPFKEWIRKNSDFSAQKDVAEQVNAMFADIDNSIRYLVGRGVVTDQITPQFDLDMNGYGDGVPFKLTVGGTELAAEAASDADNTWNFGVDAEGKPLYSISWNEGTKTFTWNINVPVENSNPLKLNYKLVWNGTGKPDKETDTNAETTLDYWKSTTTDPTASRDGREKFESPKVIYRDGGTLTIKKVASGAETPTTATFTVTDAAGKATTVTYADFTNGSYTLPEKLPAGEYTVAESGADVNGYTLKTEYTNDGEVTIAAGASAEITVTNTYTKKSNPVVVPVEPPVLNTEDHYAYIIGDDDGLVRPNEPISRAEVATIFFRLLTDESRDRIWSQENPFPDVLLEDWFNNAISTMTNGKILTGYPDGMFLPNNSITRAEFATIAIRFFQDAKVGPSQFSDTIGHWAEEYINKAATQGLIKGYPDGTFRPDAPITRAEAMTIINRVLDRHPDKDHLLESMIVWPDNMDTTVWYYADVQEATNSHDYKMHSEKDDLYEIWQALLPVRDWAAFEKAWSNSHAASNPGEVIGH